MKRLLLLIASLALSISGLHAEEEEVFEYNAQFNPITGEGANLAGIISPEIFVVPTGGVFGDGIGAADLATTEHDPQNDFGIQVLEVHLDINYKDVITGAVYGAGFQGNDEWEAALEEAYLHYHLNDWLAVGGGQFLNRVGFQSDKHVHGWDFVNQNLLNSRMLNEGELITQGAEMVLTLPDWRSVITIGGGGVRTHAHAHEEGDEHGHEEEEHDHEMEIGHHDEDDHDEHEGEEHHLEADDANFSDYVVSFDWRMGLPFDESATLLTSFATGENGFGRQTWVYGAGLEKIWGAHDHGDGPEFCEGAVMLRSEFMGRHIGIEDEDGERFDANDYGFSTGLFYGLGETTTLSIRHDWVSDLDELELEDRHRISPALTFFLDKNQRIKTRLQYDYNTSDSLGEEHAAWLQFQVMWGGHGGAHHHH
tara:strand:- start:20974 stop:22242 length:1269 start_codon:yes stop_codon:yes gene_type:complete